MNQAALVEYLETLSGVHQIYDHADRQYRCYEELILAHGRPMVEEVTTLDIQHGTPRECFANSQDLVFADASLTYVEGYATFETLPIAVPHAWTLNKEGSVIDPTWAQESRYYFGIALDTEWLLDLLSDRVSRDRTNHRAVFEGNFQEGHSFLYNGLPAAAFAEPEMAIPAASRSVIAEPGGQQDY